MKKRIFALLLVVTVLFCAPLTAFAHSIPQERNDCSIEIVVRYDGKNVDGGTLTAIRVGYVEEKDGDYCFLQEMTGAPLDNIESADAANTQKKFYDSNKGKFEFYTQTKDVKDGKATFSDLSTGIYLIVQNQAADGFSKMGAFLVSVPYLENGEYQYHVTASIKSELEREPDPTNPAPTTPDDPKLPQTGQLNWPIPVMVVVGLVLFVAGWILRFKRGRECYEK